MSIWGNNEFILLSMGFVTQLSKAVKSCLRRVKPTVKNTCQRRPKSAHCKRSHQVKFFLLVAKSCLTEVPKEAACYKEEALKLFKERTFQDMRLFHLSFLFKLFQAEQIGNGATDAYLIYITWQMIDLLKLPGGRQGMTKWNHWRI